MRYNFIFILFFAMIYNTYGLEEWSNNVVVEEEMSNYKSVEESYIFLDGDKWVRIMIMNVCGGIYIQLYYPEVIDFLKEGWMIINMGSEIFLGNYYELLI